MSDFLSQGGYGFYVWTAYGVSAAAIAGLVIWAVTGWHKAKVLVQAAGRDEDTP